MNKIRFKELFGRYYNKTASVNEKMELMQLVKEASVEQLTDLIRESGENLVVYDYGLPIDKTEAILQTILDEAPVRRMSWKKMAVAASVLLIVGLGSYFTFSTKRGNADAGVLVISKQLKNDIDPGSFKAKLKLADGTTIILDSTKIGKLAQQGNTVITRRNGGLVYSNESPGASSDLIMNTVVTNNGETYSLVLADGSKVWLNAASSVSFPVTFTGKERRVAITGEVYIEVAKNAKQPFIVSVNDMEVKALGTEFNINAYRDEATMNTTLIKGSVKISRSIIGSESSILSPGQQAQLSGSGLVVQNVDTDKVIAWKDGKFNFENADLKTILRQFARWYDVEIIYESTIKERKFFGIVKRSNKLVDVLEMLKDNNIKFRIEGRKLYVVSG
ncbi:MAG: FecR domain-containing protein [Ginsengibacter sp.]